MKRSKLTLGIVTALVGVAGLTACNEATYSDGLVLEYKDPSTGEVTKLTAEDLFGTYYSTSVASTDFDRVYEILIRKHFEGSSSFSELKAQAQKDVQDIKDQAAENANTNNTSYQEEFSKLLSTNGCENVTELYEAKLYAAEKEAFEKEYDTNAMIEKMRDGDGIFKASEQFGVGSDGYLVEQMPYTVSHILVKLASASHGEHAQATISEAESRKLGQVVELLAGAKLADPEAAADPRTDFGTIALQNSEDTGSAAKYGQLSVMDRDTADSFINEFKFGIYAYESIYNQVNTDATKNPYAAAVNAHANTGTSYKLLDKIKFSSNATYTDSSSDQTADEAELKEGEHYIANYFKTTGAQIGRIPYGAAVALAREDVAKNDFIVDGGDTKMNWQVNNGSSTYYPRNILFNKYFNNHKVAVIVPNEIPYNDPAIGNLGTAGDYTSENFVGAIKASYAALPGFSRDTKELLPASVLGQDSNVLTTERGQIVLAVRGGSSGSYEGIHFMVIDRSALEEIVTVNDDYSTSLVDMTLEQYNESTLKTTSNSNSLSEYYTVYRPTEANFPTYTQGAKEVDKITYINQLHTTNTAYKENVETLTGKIKAYNSNKDSYLFQRLYEEHNITFASNDVAQLAEEQIKTWIESKRNKSAIDSRESFDDTWATYIEFLTAQDQARALNKDGSQRLISETCAIGYNKKSSDPKENDPLWSTGGACYAK